MKCIAYRRPDGGTSIVHPARWNRLVAAVTAEGERITFDPPVSFDVVAKRYGDDVPVEWAENEDRLVARIRRKDVPADAADVTIVDEAGIPEDRTFRDAWRPDLSVDMERARGVQRERLRRLRKPILEGLDVAYVRADERGDGEEKRQVAERKQRLRDVTADPAIDAAQTPEELKVAGVEALA